MRSRSALLSTAMIASLLALIGCGRSPAVEVADVRDTYQPPHEILVKENLLRETPRAAIKPLGVERIIKKGEGGGFVFPSSLVFSGGGGTYVSDNIGHAIYFYQRGASSAPPLTKQNGEGKLHFPNTIREWQNQLIVSDNDGLKFYGQDGTFRRLVRAYYGIFHFVVSDGGRVFINPIFGPSKTPKPLIVELDMDGSKIKDFGGPSKPEEYRGDGERAYLASAGGWIFAAFKNRPLVRVYKAETGELVREIKVEHPIFDRLAQQLSEGAMSDGQNKTAPPRYIAGLSLVEDRLLVLLHLPHAEIVELDFHGRETDRYRFDGPTAVDYFGFDARSAGNKYAFSVGIIEPQWLPTLVELNSDTRGLSTFN